MRTTAALALGVSLMATSALAATEGDWMIRVRALGVLPDESSTISPIGGKAHVDNSVVPELDISYFFTPNIAAELILATTPHDVEVRGLGAPIDVGDVWLLPPTLTLQYHFTQFKGFKPYVGAGVNYTMFYNEDPGSMTSVDYDNSFGPALQAGVDIALKEHWYLNFDVKKVWIDTTADFNSGGVRADVDIDPWLVGLGLAYRF